MTGFKSKRAMAMGTNLCQEILLSPSQMCTLGYPKTSAALKRLMQTKYQFSRAKWHISYFRWQDQHLVYEWCEQQFGPMPKTPDAWSRWKTMPSNSIAFRDEKDHVWFTLKWGI